jgi:hypothetical protein
MERGVAIPSQTSTQRSAGKARQALPLWADVDKVGWVGIDLPVLMVATRRFKAPATPF